MMEVQLTSGDVYGGFYINICVYAERTGDIPGYKIYYHYVDAGEPSANAKNVTGQSMDDAGVAVGDAIVAFFETAPDGALDDDEKRLLVTDIVRIIKEAIMVEKH